MAGMAFSKVYSEVESTEDHWVSGSMSEEDTAPWVVMLPQSNQIKSKQSKAKQTKWKFFFASKFQKLCRAINRALVISQHKCQVENGQFCPFFVMI